MMQIRLKFKRFDKWSKIYISYISPKVTFSKDWIFWRNISVWFTREGLSMNIFLPRIWEDFLMLFQKQSETRFYFLVNENSSIKKEREQKLFRMWGFLLTFSWKIPCFNIESSSREINVFKNTFCFVHTSSAIAKNILWQTRCW